MKIIYLLLFVTELFSSVYAVDKKNPEYPQSLISFNSPLREVTLRWEYSQFGKTFNRNTGQLINNGGISIATVLRGKTKNVNGFITSIEQEKLSYAKNSAQEEFNKLKEKLNSGILPETLATSKIVPFIVKSDGTRLIDNVDVVPEINTIEQLREFLSKNNIDFKKNLIKIEHFDYNTLSDNEKLSTNYIKSINTNTKLYGKECNYDLINSCIDVYEFVRIINNIGSLSIGELECIGRRATEIMSNDMKENSILLITLTQFGIDTKAFMEKLSEFDINNNQHIILRALSESKIKPEEYSNIFKEKMNNIYDNYFSQFEHNDFIVDVKVDEIDTDVKLKHMEKYNYICSYCKFISKNVVKNLSHINVIESYVKMCKDHNRNELDLYTVQQLVDICYHLALVNSECCKILMDKLHDMNFYKKVHYSELIQMFTKVSPFDEKHRFNNVEKLVLEMYKSDGFTLGLDDCVNILVAIGRSRNSGVILIDKVVDDIKNYTNELDLNHITKILINLSKVNYNNRGFIRHMANMMLTFLDEDSILDPFTISNAIKSFGRFNYYNEKLIKILLTITEKEEVLAEFKLHDLVTIFTSLCKIFSSNLLKNSKLNINRFMRILACKISNSDLNTESSIKLINASGKILYNNERFLNTLIESINLNEVDDLSILCKLKINCDKLSLFYPELTRRIEELERRLRPVSDEDVETGDKFEDKSMFDDSDIEDYQRSVYVRRNVMYRDLKLPSVRKRKWTY